MKPSLTPELIEVIWPDGQADTVTMYRCKKRWTRLQRTDDPAVRFCKDCETNVNRVQNASDRRFFELVSSGPCCVALVELEIVGMQMGPDELAEADRRRRGRKPAPA
jgi:hypothetical protein